MSVSSDLERVTEAVAGLEDGEYEVDLAVDRDDEVGRLAAAVESLGATLATHDGDHQRTDGTEPPDAGGAESTSPGEQRQMVAESGPQDADAVAVESSRDVSDEADAFDLEWYGTYAEELLEAIDDLVYVLDADGYLVEWTDRFASVLGYDDEELSSMHTLELFEGEDADAIREAFEHDEMRVEASIRTADGEEIPFEFVASRLEDPAGNPIYVGIGRDVSDRVERERELRERERQLSTLMSNVPGMVYRCRNEPDWPFEFVSEGCAELTGYEPATLVDGPVNWGEDVIADDHADDLWETVQECVRQREPFRVTYPIETADGERRWLKEQGRPVSDEAGELDGLEGVIIDVSDRVTNERDLERTSRLLEQSQHLASVGAWELDLETEPHPVTATDEAKRIAGLAPDAELDLERALSLYHPDDRERIREVIDRTVEEGDAWDIEVRIVTPDDETRWVRAIGEPIVEDDEIVGLRGSMQDVTERTRRERTLEQTTEHLDTVLSNVPIVVFALDANGTFTLSRGTGLGAFDLEPGELVGESIVDRYGWHDGVTTDAKRALDGEQISTTRTIDETVFETSYQPVVEDGAVERVIGVTVDVTDRVEHERELERTRELLEQVERLAESGGWEYDLQADPPEVTATEGLRRLVGLDPDESPGLWTAIERVVPADRERVRGAIEAAIERGESYDVEHRLETDRGTRWVRSVGEPVYECDSAGETTDGTTGAEEGSGTEDPGIGSDAEPVAIRGSLQDVTDHKERELAFESLHAVARELLGVEDRESVAAKVVEAASDLLEGAGVAAYGLDTDENRLEPLSFNPRFVELCDGTPSVAVGATDSQLWQAFATDSRRVVDGAADAGADCFGSAVDQALLLPVGDEGVFVVATADGSIDGDDRRLVETLAATAEAALDRLHNEAALREREAQLEARNRRLERQIGITEIIRSINQSLVGAESRSEIEATVPERLVEAEGIEFAWIGTVDAADERLVPRTWAGDGESYLDEVSLTLDGSDEPAVRTARTETTTVVDAVVEELKEESWRKTALSRNVNAAISVPLTVDGYTVGVLTAYGADPGRFDELERTVFTELGTGIANAITDLETREALHAETVAEVSLEIDDLDDPLARIAETTATTVDFEGLGSYDAEEAQLFFRTDVADVDAVTTAMEELVSVTEWRLVSDAGDEALYQATVEGSTLASWLVRHGASPRSIRATVDGTTVVVDVPATTDVREFVETVSTQYGDADLRGRRQVERTVNGGERHRPSLFEPLTDRQLEVLRTAYHAGFFDWPRESSGEDVADLLDVTQPTINRHLRLAQRRLLEQLFDGDAIAASGRVA